MDTRRISVDHDSVTTTIASIEETIDVIEQGLDHLESRAAVLRSSWDGEARQAFDIAHARWDASLRELNAIAHAMSAVAHSSNSRFQEHDRRGAQAWQV